MRICFLILAASGLLAQSAEAPKLLTYGTTNIAGGGSSFALSMTPDGRRVVFASHANNLVTNDDLRSYSDIFIRDRFTGVTSLVSVNTNGSGGGDGNSGYASISDNGRYVVFSSDAGNLVSHDTDGLSDVFRRDLHSGTTELVSVGLAGGVPSPSLSAPIGGASKPVMTANGRWIAFESASIDLVTGDTNSTRKVFVRDMRQKTTFLASVGTYRSWSPSLSANGRRVAFLAVAADIFPGRTNITGDVFMRDLQASTTSWVSTNVAEILANTNYTCRHPALAPNGDFVVFKARTNGYSRAPTHVLHHDLTTGITTLLATNSYPNTAAQLSTDSQWLAFEENGNIYLRDLLNRTNLLVSADLAGNPPPTGGSHSPVVTSGARFVAFVSSAPNLVADGVTDTNSFYLYVRDIASGITHLVTRGRDGIPISVPESTFPLISADGQSIVFDSTDSSFVTNDNNQASDVFAHDLRNRATSMLSMRHEQRASRTGIQSAGISANSISADGQRIAFVSFDDPRVPGDTNRFPDAFVFDVPSQRLIPQSVEADGSFNPTNRASAVMISADGTHVLFAVASNPGQLYSGGEEFRLKWRAVDGGPVRDLPSSGSAFAPPNAALSSNGTIVVYSPNVFCLADMVAGTTRYFFEYPRGGRLQFMPDEQWVLASFSDAGGILFALNLNSNRVLRISKAPDGSLLSVVTFVLDAAGRYCVFDTYPSRVVYRYDFQTDSSRFIYTNCQSPSVDRTGNVIALAAGPFSPARQDIFVIDLAAGTTNLASPNYSGTGGGNGNSKSPLVSGDGRYILFLSSASDLVLGDNNDAQDVFVHDRLQKSTMLISRDYTGKGSGNALSSMPVMARDGRTVVFQSFASDLIEGDHNEKRDIFMLRLGTSDSDNDGMDDDWEVAFFGDLSRDGTADFDHDGHSDLQEFLAGTDPTNTGSILRVLTITPMSGGNTTIVWSAVPGRSYVVQFKDSLDTPNWSNASGVLTASLTSESFNLVSNAPKRFYRVVAVQ